MGKRRRGVGEGNREIKGKVGRLGRKGKGTNKEGIGKGEGTNTETVKQYYLYTVGYKI